MLLCFLGEELKLPVTSRDYMSKLVEYGIMKLCASATVKETNQTWIEEDDFQVIMPSVDIKVVIHLNDVIKCLSRDGHSGTLLTILLLLFFLNKL
jgi:hypothetical protein